MQQAIDSARDFLSSTNPKWLAVVAAVVLLVLLLPRLIGAWRSWGRQSESSPESDLEVDLATFGNQGPDPSDPVRFFCRQYPARIALVIVAPLGRDQTAPGTAELIDAAESVAPGLGKVIGRDRPEVRAWPAQLSAQGFIHKVFRHVRLPGGRGQGTPWVLVAGRAQGPERSFLLALALCGAEPNGLGEIAVDSEEKWLDILRVRDED